MLGVLHLLTQVLCGLAFAMLFPAAIALVDGDIANVESFVLVAGLTGFVAGATFFALRGRRWQLDRFSAFMLLLLVWIVPPLIAAVPIMTGARIGYLPALFEAVSAYTTTGATLLGAGDSLAPAVIFWRAELQWLGGLMTLVSIAAVLAPAGVGGLTDRDLALLGPGGEGSLGRSPGIVGTIAVTYFVATAICLGLLLLSGVPAFDSVCLAFATLSTGGLLPNQGTLDDYGLPFAELVIAVFMLVGATSIVWHRMILQGRWALALGHRESYWVIAAALAIGIVYAFEFSAGNGPAGMAPGFEALGHGLFTGISLVTTTGFEPVSGALAAVPVAVAGALAIIGAATMSTAGGIKFYRLGGMLVQSAHETRRLIYPHSVRSTHFGSQPYDISLMKAIWAGAIVGLATVALASLLLALNHPTFHGGAIAAISAFSNVGPLYASPWEGSANWPAYAEFDGFSQTVLAVTMTLGRLEAIALLALFHVAYWRS